MKSNQLMPVAAHYTAEKKKKPRRKRTQKTTTTMDSNAPCAHGPKQPAPKFSRNIILYADDAIFNVKKKSVIMCPKAQATVVQ